jgi:RNA polymerase sigma-70 factor (ECF subfamily)
MDTRFLRLASAAALASETRTGKIPVTLQDQVAEIYESLREEVFRYLLVLGVGPDLAQEVCQEVFLRLYAALRKGQGIDNTRAWVFTVARNCALSARVSDAMLESLEPLMEDQLAEASPSPERALLDREKFRRLHDAVSNLSPQQRHCLHLRVEGFRYREIADIVGISTSTVGEFLSRAVKRLRRALYE